MVSPEPSASVAESVPERNCDVHFHFRIRSNTVSSKCSPPPPDRDDERTKSEMRKMSYRDAHSSRITVDAGSSNNNNNAVCYDYSPRKPNSKHEKKSSFIEDAIKNFWTNLDDVTLSPINDQLHDTSTPLPSEGTTNAHVFNLRGGGVGLLVLVELFQGFFFEQKTCQLRLSYSNRVDERLGFSKLEFEF